MTPLQKHQRERQRQIIAPVAVPFFLLLLGAVVLFVLAVMGHISEQQVNVIAGIMFALCILLPSAILMFLFSGVMLLAAFGSGRLRVWASTLLDWLHAYSEKGAALTEKTAWRLIDPIIAVRVQAARWRYILVAVLGFDVQRNGESDSEKKGE